MLEPVDEVDPELHVVVGRLVLDGYRADFCGESVADEPLPRVRRAYEHIRAAALARVESARGRTLAAEVASGVAGELPRSGGRVYGRFGHGIGVELAEPPSLHIEGTHRTRADHDAVH